MAVRIVTDSACDLPESVCDALGIVVVPLTVRFGDHEYVDRTELTSELFWEKLAEAKEMPQTAAPPVGAFAEAFQQLIADGATGIVCISLSSKLSGTMQSAQLAADSLAGTCPIAVVDSMSASMGIGILAVHAAHRAQEGADVATLVSEVESRRERQHVLATLDTLEYLRKGGRIGAAQAMLGSVLSVKPVITVKDGMVEPADKVRTRSRALRMVADHLAGTDVEAVCVLHADAPDLEDFLELLRPAVGDAEILVGQIGPVIGTHAGPRAIGVVWLEREVTP